MRKVQSLAERFEKHVDRSGGPDACHLWTGGYSGKYGRVYVGKENGQPVSDGAHRVAWQLAHGAIPEETPWILHNCPGGDNPGCCNDRHLWAGTREENMADMVAKGRACAGARHPNAKLTMRVAQRLRREHAAGASAIKLARRYTIPRGTVRAILEGRTWQSRRHTRVG